MREQGIHLFIKSVTCLIVTHDMAQDQAIAALLCSSLDNFLPQPIMIVFYVYSEQNMSLFGQILWLGWLSIDISLFLFCILFHVLIEFELADREIGVCLRSSTSPFCPDPT